MLKLELWKYSIYDMENAEDHLNEMAQKGYEFLGISTAFLRCVAVYRKTGSIAMNKRYGIDILVGDENYDEKISFYADGGWHIKFRQSEFTVFVKDEGRYNDDLYSDSFARVYGLNRYNSVFGLKSAVLSAITILLVIILLAYSMLRDESDISFIKIPGMWMAIFYCSVLYIGINLQRIIAGYSMRVKEELPSGRTLNVLRFISTFLAYAMISMEMILIALGILIMIMGKAVIGNYLGVPLLVAITAGMPLFQVIDLAMYMAHRDGYRYAPRIVVYIAAFADFVAAYLLIFSSFNFT